MRRYKIALILGLLALSAAACGDDSDDDGVASADDDATQSAEAEEDGGGPEDGFEEALAYSECMRENGIEEFPDPEKNDDGGMSLSLPEGFDTEDEDFQAAEEACEDLAPGPEEGATIDPEIYAGLVEYAECMRENGVEDFPDPEPNGGIRMDGDVGSDPDFQSAQTACEDLEPEGEGAPGTDSGGE